jgi:glycosyltransferase involved in cell wall biosynthesis
LDRWLVRYFQRGFRDGWQSFDRKPWHHPWLTSDNLRKMQEFSKAVRGDLRRFRETHPEKSSRYAFVCNIANSMYTTAKTLRPLGVHADLFPHPFDDSLMSQPEWEELDGSMQAGLSYTQALQSGLKFPELSGVIRTWVTDGWQLREDMPSWVKSSDYYRWRNYYSFLPMLRELRKYDALFAIQSPYLAYLASKPYIATHMGGDIWYECSRDDQLGRLQRTAFARAKSCIASNPWSYAFARRYGMRNMVYLPTLLNPSDYSPGKSSYRRQWEEETGGKFFVLTTARADDRFKGSNIALAGFAEFAKSNPDARLVVLGWGADQEKQQRTSETLGIADKILVLPTVGKKRLIAYLRAADCLLDQFVLGYFGMTALEAMACGLSVIMKLNATQFDAFSDAGPPPVFNAHDEKQVMAALTALASNASLRAEASRRSREWFMEYSGKPQWGEAYIDVLFAAANRYGFDFSSSPLVGALSAEEKSYHATELSKAPEFPNYF